MPSFDIVSRVEMQEVDNALNQARKEVIQRYDLRTSNAEITQEEDAITITAADDFKVKAVVEVLESKLSRRGVPLKALSFGEVEPAAKGRKRIAITIQRGISGDQARELVKIIKETKLRVQAQIQQDQLRVTGKKKDDLQAVMRAIKERDLPTALQFENYRE
jgi:uncharacterized protein YajQ (UPF0234 family)